MKRYFWILVGLIIGVGIVKLLSFSTVHKKTGAAFIDSTQYKVNSVKVPAQLNFAGEAMPLQQPEVYRGLDQELLVNTYWHSRTFLHIKRARRWFPVIEKILKEEGVPEDFKYMAVAESGLNNAAVSPDGAKGMWQLRKGTAQGLGLTINEQVDERLHVEKATRAACKYLKKSYEKLGSWTLAAAAYNAGKQAIKEEVEQQQADSYYDLFLNTETGRFIYRIAAIKLILRNPHRFGFDITDFQHYAPYDFREVVIDSPITNLADFAQSHQTTYKKLKMLNPWLLKPSLQVAQNDTFVLKMPVTED